MNTLIQLKKTTAVFLTVLVLVCLTLSPPAQAVVPAPDGGYPNFTTAEGTQALQLLGAGAANTGVGWRSLFSVDGGNFNTGVGAGTLVLNTADSNTAVGAAALLLNTSGTQNVAVGTAALVHNSTGSSNTAIGWEALSSNTISAGNTAVGRYALVNNTTGTANTAIGDLALASNTTGSGNIVLGYGFGAGITTASNVICIGNDGMNVSGTTWIGNIFEVTTISSATAPVIVSDDGQLGTVVSSERFKKDIATMDKASDAILSLRPVTFHYKTDAKGTPQFGLIAEEVAKVDPALVLPDKEGKPYTVRYDQINAMLLNEFLKEHSAFIQEQHKVEKLETTVEQQHKDFEAALANLKGQIQKVSAQIAASKHAPQMVVNNQ